MPRGKGFNQVEGLDFNETFALVAKLVSVHVSLSVAAARGWELHQMDVNNTSLHGDVNEEVYMKLPQGFGMMLIIISVVFASVLWVSSSISKLVQ
ncbi:UNVERIFIED_CONTAM: Copia protein [Sesamum radiatum]|uniref:Copia protein n=1 Tax=Sesamum radiatum TaxID=300843 RepID=A0AAW2PJ84_SESRA